MIESSALKALSLSLRLATLPYIDYRAPAKVLDVGVVDEVPADIEGVVSGLIEAFSSQSVLGWARISDESMACFEFSSARCATITS